MTAPTNGTPMTAPTTADVVTRPLSGGVRADLITLADVTGITIAAQLTTPDEPLDANTLRDLAADLLDTATALEHLTVG